MIKLIMILFALSSALPLTYILTGFLDVSFALLMPALYFAVIINLVADIYIQKNKILYGFILRLSLALITGFAVLFNAPVLSSIFVSIYVLALLSIMAFIISDRFFNGGVFCFVMFSFNLILMFILRRYAAPVESEQLLNIFVIISAIASLSYYLLLNIDTVRWFGTESLKIPGSMKRSYVLILIIVCLVITIVSFASWIFETARALLAGIFNLLYRVFSLINVSWNREVREYEYFVMPDDSPLIEDIIVSSSDEGTFNPVLFWVITGALLTVVVSMAVFLLVMLVRLIIRVLRNRRGAVSFVSDVYSETIEKISPLQKKRKKRGSGGFVRYSSLSSDRERILYIYNRYVKRAQQGGFTQNNISDTPNIILEEVSQNAGEKKFPLPGNLGSLFNTAKYSDEEIVDENVGELKRRLL